MDVTNLFSNLAVFLHRLTAPVPEPEVIDAPRGRGSMIVGVRNDYKIETLPGPERSRRTHEFHELGSFADWLKRWAKPESAEILVGVTEAKAVLTEDPQSSLVSCALLHHPTFAAWNAAFGREQSPKDLLTFIRSVAVSFSDGSGGANIGDVLSGQLAQLKVATSGDIDMSVDPRGFYAVKGSTAKVTVDAKIPPVFTVHTPVFVGIPEPAGPELVVAGSHRLYSLEILLTMDVDDKKIGFTLSCPSLERVLHEARLDAVAYLRGLLGDGFLVGLGDLGTAVVPG